MWDWLYAVYGGFLILLGAAAALVALRVPENDKDRRKTAAGILKVVLAASAVTAAPAIIAVRLTETGLF